MKCRQAQMASILKEHKGFFSEFFYTAVQDPKLRCFLESQTFLARCFGPDNRTAGLCATQQGTACVAFTDLLVKRWSIVCFRWRQSLPCSSPGPQLTYFPSAVALLLEIWPLVTIGAVGLEERVEVESLCLPCFEWKWRSPRPSKPLLHFKHRVRKWSCIFKVFISAAQLISTFFQMKNSLVPKLVPNFPGFCISCHPFLPPTD